MNRDDVIRMAREAGLHLYVNDLTEEPYVNIVERFANLVAAHERKPWVGLTKEEAKEISLANRPYVIDMIAALEARLKEKNT